MRNNADAEKRPDYIRDPAVRRRVKELCEITTDLALAVSALTKQNRMKEASAQQVNYHQSMKELLTIRPSVDRASEARKVATLAWHKKMARRAARKAA